MTFFLTCRKITSCPCPRLSDHGHDLGYQIRHYLTSIGALYYSPIPKQAVGLRELTVSVIEVVLGFSNLTCLGMSSSSSDTSQTNMGRICLHYEL